MSTKEQERRRAISAALSRFPPSDGRSKVCRQCERKQPIAAFNRSRRSFDGRAPYCKRCAKKISDESKARRAARGLISYATAYNHKIRDEVLHHYCGGKEPFCACCGTKIREFLVLDHINGGGNLHRKRLGTDLYRDAKKRGFPPEYRVLCHNCNAARGSYGYCPHERPELAIANKRLGDRRQIVSVSQAVVGLGRHFAWKNVKEPMDLPVVQVSDSDLAEYFADEV